MSSNPVNGEVHSIQHYVIKFLSDLPQVSCFYQYTPGFSTNKTDRHNITEMLLKVALTTINQTKPILFFRFYGQEIRAYQILSGEVYPPVECLPLYQVLERHRERATRDLLEVAKKKALKHALSVDEKPSSRFSVSSFYMFCEYQ